MHSLIKDKKGQFHPAIAGISLAITGFIILFIGAYLMFNVIDVTDIEGRGAYATLTFTGAVDSGEWLNITTSNARYVFEFNDTSLNGDTAVCKNLPNCVAVNVTSADSALQATGALTLAMNANATVRSLIQSTYVTDTTGVVTLTYTTVGSSIPTIVLTENIAGAALSSANLTGGVATAQGATNTITYTSVTLPLMGLAIMIIGFGITLSTLMGGFRAGRKR